MAIFEFTLVRYAFDILLKNIEYRIFHFEDICLIRSTQKQILPLDVDYVPKCVEEEVFKLF